MNQLSITLFVFTFALSAMATNFKDVTPAQAIADIREKNKHVVTFIGFSGAEYENKEAMLAFAESRLKSLNPKKHVVNIGGTYQGIGAVYDLAKKMGFETTGIVSTQAKAYDGYQKDFPASVDHVYFIQDSTWGGENAETKTLNPTSQAMVDASDSVIVIGGGDIGRDEMKAARLKGKSVSFMGADMNMNVAIAKAEKKKLPRPSEFRGSAELEMIKQGQRFERIANASTATGKSLVPVAPGSAK